MGKVHHVRSREVPSEHTHQHPAFEYHVRRLLPQEIGKQCQVSLYEIPPGKSNYPYHYHMHNEECFYILSGLGRLRTPEGEREVRAGDFIYLPAGEEGAHRLTNIGESEPLTYLDFDTQHELNVCFYPDSQKMAVWGMGINKIYREGEDVAYYDGE